MKIKGTSLLHLRFIMNIKVLNLHRFKHDQLKQTLMPLEKHFSQPVPHEKQL
jgi:hypothetical protein